MDNDLSDKIIIALITFILTSLIGALWTSLLSSRSWKRNTKIELFRKRYEEGTKFFDDLSKIIGKRFFLLQRFLWAIESNDKDRIDRACNKYFEAIDEWNFHFWLNRNKIRLLLSEKHAEMFLTYKDDNNLNNPSSLHYKFVNAHRAVMSAKNDKSKYEMAQITVTKLNWACSTFLETLTTDFLFEATSLNLLEIPNNDEKVVVSSESTP